LEISVSDNGGGIPEAELKHIFKKLYRVSRDTNQEKGHGLGLYICKLIVKAHGGVIRAENNQMGGVTFTFSLPVGT
jgi:signal transduction histidine kinase